ncbi:hypothetical protein DL96DRAFT_1713563 [Flagelloscypha sp. PMI_526]|nr:hypothetical protein DL96DRAFT_1713563 [Flagelloscypha sp. PMI_526]
MSRTNASLLIDSDDLGHFDDSTFRSHWTNEHSDLASVCLMNSCLLTSQASSNASNSIEFDGTSVTLWGIDTKSRVLGMSGDVDGRPNTPAINPKSPVWGPIYATSTTGSESHTLKLEGIPPGVYLDFAVATGPYKYSLKAETLIVDDNDPLVKYTGGGWQETDEQFKVIDNTPTLAYGGKTHSTSTVGDVLQFPFTGDTVSVYGYLLNNVEGNFSISFDIDGTSSSEKSFPPSDLSDPITPNFLFLDEKLSAGDHVLTAKMTKVSGKQRFILDYILYEATFDRLEDMPVINLPPVDSSAPPTSTMTVAGGAATAGTTPESGSGKSTNVGAIAGGVIGGLVVLAGLGFVIFILRRRSLAAKEHSKTKPAPFVGVPPPHRASLSSPEDSPQLEKGYGGQPGYDVQSLTLTQPPSSPILPATTPRLSTPSSKRKNVPALTTALTTTNPNQEESSPITTQATASTINSSELRRIQALERRIEELEYERTAPPPRYPSGSDS